MRLIIQPDSNGVSEWAAAYIVKRIRERKACCNRPFVLGLPTGSTPLGTYKALIRYCQEGAVSFADVITFNMDEYVGIPREQATTRSCGTTSSAISTSSLRTSIS